MRHKMNNPAGGATPGGVVRISNIRILGVGTKVASVTIIAESFFGLHVDDCLLHQDARGNRWVQYPSRAYLKKDGTPAFQTTHRFGLLAAKRAFTDTVFMLYDAYLASNPQPLDVIDDILSPAAASPPEDEDWLDLPGGAPC